MKVKLLLLLLLIMGNTAFSQKRIGHVTLLKKNAESGIKAHRKPDLQNRWFKHSNNIGHCGGNGVFCLRKSIADGGKVTLEEDETLSQTSIVLKGNTIVIQCLAVKGTISPKTWAAFKNKEVKPEGNFIAAEILTELFDEIGLNVPKEGITIQTNQQTYTTYQAEDNGKKVGIIESVDKTKIVVDGKKYNLIIITTSGKGSGSPKAQGF